MYWNLLSVFVIVFCFEQIWRCWVQKHSSFVCRLNGYRAQLCSTFVVSAASASRSTAAGKPPEVRRRCTTRRATATSRLRSFWSPKAPRWTPRGTMARGLKVMGSRAWNRVSDLGTSVRRFFRDCIFRNDMICRWKHKSSDGPLSNIVQSINGKLFWMSSLASLMDPSFWRRGPVCYQIPDGIWPMSGHVSMNDQSSKWFRIVSANLHK